MAYRHPGHWFVAEQGPLTSEADVMQYVAFLRRVAGLGLEPPIDLGRIYAAFGMPVPLRAPLADQQGILVDGDRGLILIKEDDPVVRQRFTEGHELMELLFEAQVQVRTQLGQGYQPEPEYKETLCDRGAAMLLLPEESFGSRLRKLGVSLTTARMLAGQYQVSLLATLRRMMDCGSGGYCLVVWRLVPEGSTYALRVWWRSPMADWGGGFVPWNKSVERTSVIHLAHKLGQSCQGSESLTFGAGPLRCYVEAQPMMIGRQAAVLSLVQFLGVK